MKAKRNRRGVLEVRVRLANELIESAARCKVSADRQTWDDGKFERGMAAGYLSAARAVAWDFIYYAHLRA